MDVLCDAIGFTLPPDHPDSEQTITISRAQQQGPPTPQSRLSPQFGPAHRCSLCGRTYERADHLNRHLKSHENARPHKCTRCPKSFNRADLLNRHQASHDRHTSGSSDRPRIERGDRVTSACLACVASKAKCQDQKPCQRCLRRNIPCETNSGSGQNNSRPLSVAGLDGSRDGDVSPPMPELAASGQGADHMRELQRNSSIQSDVFSNQDLQYSGNIFDNTMSNRLAMETPSVSAVQRDIHTSGSGFFNDEAPSNVVPPFFDNSFQNFGYVPGDPQYSQGLGFMPPDSYFSQDLDFGMWDIDLDSVELAYQNVNTAQLPQSNTSQRTSATPATQKDVSKRYAAFERSPWVWNPTQKDQAMNDSSNLNLDEESIPSVLTPTSPAAVMEQFASCCINSKMRDQMLGLLFTLRKSENQVPSFPSLNLLNSIIPIYFVQASFFVDNFIHTATFNPEKALPQLFLAIISAGSTLISTPAIWKMGLALQETVRHTVADFWEQNNSNTRNLQAIQAFVLGIDVGLWSGFKRKMEIAESFAQPVIVMLRRAGAFAPPRNSSIFWPERNDSDAVIESKWRKWAERESFKRLVLHLFVHDITASIGLQKPPLISFTELKFSIPVSRQLWLAKTSTEWRDAYFANHTSPPNFPTFLELMQSPDTLAQFSPNVDTHLCAIILLHGFWGQIWSLLESKKFYPPSKATHRLCLLTSHTELYRDLSDFSSRIPSLTRNSPDATLLAELFMMIMHAAPEDLQRFAGKFGESEARLASTDFQSWSHTLDARIAIWHAGQVFRAAKRLMPAQLRGFNAIAVYYASLTLWVYGLMTSGSSISRPPSASSQPILNGPQAPVNIILNEGETSQLRNFRSNDEGVPGLIVTDSERSSQFVPLEATDRILGVARDIYRDNFPMLEEPLPPLVENLGNLLRDLGSLPGSRVSRAPSEGAG